MSVMEPKARVAMLGCGFIGRKNARAIMRAKNAELAAVASRDIERCQQYCAELQLPESVARLGGYSDALEDASVDIVYVALPMALHLEWVLKAAAAGKHVLVEKPVARDAAEAGQMVQACRDAGVQLMDGLMFIHHARFAKIRAIFEDPMTWQPVRVSAGFSFKATAEYLRDNIRVKPDCEPLGCLGDLGWYLIRIGLAAFRWERPEAVSARVHAATSAGIPLDADVDIYWPPAASSPPAWATASSAGDSEEGLGAAMAPQRIMTFHCSFLHPWRQWYEAVSHNGKVVRCRDLCIPRCEQICNFELEHTIGTTDIDCSAVADCAVVPTFDCAQEVCMWERMASITLSRTKDPFFEDVILLTQTIIDAALALLAQAAAA
eukprot:CAMPEP_0197909720 /NCGR_PEP_ID=MMETSP1439-20131203/69430_1 /TAXON_ID=66791 /ORGANISM="Gonyaulax spinifera, Strain CCMP409" /LENGTH=377 /DNA_ID=CAMNT_0043531325 /DNA_START=76 /DNA_END=1210 /DNA_ORIENTATION=-